MKYGSPLEMSPHVFIEYMFSTLVGMINLKKSYSASADKIIQNGQQRIQFGQIRRKFMPQETYKKTWSNNDIPTHEIFALT